MKLISWTNLFEGLVRQQVLVRQLKSTETSNTENTSKDYYLKEELKKLKALEKQNPEGIALERSLKFAYQEVMKHTLKAET